MLKCCLHTTPRPHTPFSGMGGAHTTQGVTYISYPTSFASPTIGRVSIVAYHLTIEDGMWYGYICYARSLWCASHANEAEEKLRWYLKLCATTPALPQTADRH